MFFVPQAIGVPIIQRIVNRFIARRIGLQRDFRRAGGRSRCGAWRPTRIRPRRRARAKLDAIYGNRIPIYLWKFASKGLVNFCNGLAPVTAVVVGFERLADPLRELIAFYRLAAQSRVRHDAIARWM